MCMYVHVCLHLVTHTCTTRVYVYVCARVPVSCDTYMYHTRYVYVCARVPACFDIHILRTCMALSRPRVSAEACLHTHSCTFLYISAHKHHILFPDTQTPQMCIICICVRTSMCCDIHMTYHTSYMRRVRLFHVLARTRLRTCLCLL